MIRQPFGPMLGALDCETNRDFGQYYRGRYFAISPALIGVFPKEPGEVLPCGLVRVNATGGLQLCTLRGEEPYIFEAPWAAMDAHGRFGHPFQSTVPVGVTYSYIYQNTVRESVKGISLDRLVWYIPDYHSKALTGYFNKNGLSLANPSYCGKQELTFLYDLYNRNMFGWEEAINLLERGERIGCNVSPFLGIHFVEGKRDIALTYKTDEVGHINSSTGNVHLHPNYGALYPILNTHLPNVEIH